MRPQAEQVEQQQDVVTKSLCSYNWDIALGYSYSDFAINQQNKKPKSYGCL